MKTSFFFVSLLHLSCHNGIHTATLTHFIGATRQPIGTFQQNGMDEGGKFQEHFMYLNITNCNGLEMFYNSTNLFQWEGTLETVHIIPTFKLVNKF